jgi:hypothetical protein
MEGYEFEEIEMPGVGGRAPPSAKCVKPKTQTVEPVGALRLFKRKPIKNIVRCEFQQLRRECPLKRQLDKSLSVVR